MPIYNPIFHPVFDVNTEDVGSRPNAGRGLRRALELSRNRRQGCPDTRLWQGCCPLTPHAPVLSLPQVVFNPGTNQLWGGLQTRYTDYCVTVRTNLPIFRLTESKVRRRYSDFDWLRGELERDSKILVPALPGKAVARQVAPARVANCCRAFFRV